MSLMEKECKSILAVSVCAAVVMIYARWASYKFPPGTYRLLALLPAMAVVELLPFSFSSVHLCGIAAFFLGWLGIFKLALLSFGSGPLHPSLPLLTFISIACLPVKLQELRKEEKTSPQHPFINSGSVNTVLLALVLSLYRYKESISPFLLNILYSIHLYLVLDVILAFTSVITRTVLGLDLEPQFDAPYLSTSLQDFWGRRWNLMVTKILRLSVYSPTRARWGKEVAVLATFLVSGVMHEVMVYFYMLPNFAKPTGELTCFFLLHGLCLVVENKARRKWQIAVHPALAAPLTVGFVAVTGAWLFFPPIMRTDIKTKMFEELAAVNGLIWAPWSW